MSIELYEHQRLAIEQLQNGKILCAGTGTGKTRTALAYFYIKECKGSMQIKIKTENGFDIHGEDGPMKEPKKLYVITTAKKRDTKDWEIEALPFGIKDIVVDSWNNIGKYTNVMNAFFIFDEQRVVGYGSWAKKFIRITKHNHWILLSATPSDTWMDLVPVFIANGFYRNKSEFVNRHVVFAPYVSYPKIQKYLEVGRLSKLKEMIMVYMEFTKPAVEHHYDIFCAYDEDKYSLIHRMNWNPFEKCPVRNVSAKCYLERYLINTDISRIEEVTKLIKTHPKVIVFYNFDYELEILRKIAADLDIPKAELNGHMHQEIPKTSEWVYLVQYNSGSEAWNCIETNALIFYSLNYSYRIMEQSIGRISRANTPFSDLYYYHVQSKAPIDRGIKRALKNKKKFNERSYTKII